MDARRSGLRGVRVPSDGCAAPPPFGRSGRWDHALSLSLRGHPRNLPIPATPQLSPARVVRSAIPQTILLSSVSGARHLAALSVPSRSCLAEFRCRLSHVTPCSRQSAGVGRAWDGPVGGMSVPALERRRVCARRWALCHRAVHRRCPPPLVLSPPEAPPPGVCLWSCLRDPMPDAPLRWG